MPESREPAPVDTVRDIERALTRLRMRARARLAFQRLGLIIAWVCAAALALGVLDYLLRLPVPLRLVLWGLGAWAIGVSVWRHVRPAMSFFPSLTEFALRLEQTPEGRQAGLSGVLASGLELARTHPATNAPDNSTLRALAAQDAAQRFAALRRPANALNPRGLRRVLAGLAAAGLPIALASVFAPALLSIGAERVLAPWTGATWPKRTGVADATGLIAHPIGAPIPLRALLTRAPGDPTQQSIAVEFAVEVGGKAGPSRRALLTPQNKEISVDPGLGAQPLTGQLFERLLETAALIPPGAENAGAPVALRYRFESSDDRTGESRVLLVQAPSVRGASLSVELPAYLASLPGQGLEAVRGRRDLGPGRDERAVAGPILSGSHVRLALTLNKVVPTPAPENLGAFLAATLPGAESLTNLKATFNAADWSFEFDADHSLRLPVVLRDQYGLTSAEEAAYRLEVTPDRSAAAAVVEPPSDESVLPTALVPAAAEGRDDVALAWTKLTAQPARTPTGSVGAFPTPSGEPDIAAEAAPADSGAVSPRLSAAADISLTELKLKSGDEVWLHAVVQDLAGQALGAAPVTSPRRRLRIISESDFVEQIRAELSGVREAAVKLSQQQAALEERGTQAEKNPEAAGDQATEQGAVSDRLSPMNDVVKRLASRVERNRMDDATVKGVLDDAQALLTSAAEKSDQAEAGLERLAAPNQPAEERAAQSRDVASAQSEARQDLESLADLLDRGQDTWAAQRALSKLLTEQRQLRSRSAAAGAGVQGKKAEELTQAEQNQLSDLAREQRELSQRAAALMDTLRTRAEQLQEADKARADAIKAAAEKGRTQRLADKQNEASKQLAQNQTAGATELQDQASATLQEMLDEVDKGDQKRDEALRRVLADVLDSIKRLIASQETELDRLAKSVAGDAGAPAPSALDTALISLNQNTLGVAQRVREEIKSAQKLLSLLRSASDAQGDAISALRLSPADTGEADQAERSSLARLKDALAEAEKLDQQAEDRDQQRQRAELKKAYQEALELQLALTADTAPLVGKELTRRDRAAARTLGERQRQIRERLAALRSSTEELADATMFEFAHQRLDDAAADASARLAAGDAPGVVGRDQRTCVRVLQGLVTALAEDKKPDDFREDQQGGGGGSQGGNAKQPLIAPIAELKLLRAMQAEAMELTRELENATGEDLAPATRLQQSLSEHAEALLKKLTEQNGGEEAAP